jgi:mono/diheme cytochrome c family protein
MKFKHAIIAVSASAVVLVSCTKDPNSPGYEYMPDMYRSGAVEAYVDYEKDSISARIPAAGTIAYHADSFMAAVNMPYTLRALEDYELSNNVKNPVPYSEAVIKSGEKLYKKYCLHCHGEKGDGQGPIAVAGKISGVPAYNGTIKDLSEGKMFHSITHGKGVMGSHAAQMNKLERWEVIHYILALRNGGTSPYAQPAVTDSASTVTTTATTNGQ